MSLFYSIDKKARRKAMKKCFLDCGLPNLYKLGFEKSPYLDEKWFGSYDQGSYDYSLDFLATDSILLHLRVHVYCKQIVVTVQMAKLKPNPVSLDALQGLDGLGEWLTVRYGDDVRVNLGMFFTKWGYERKLRRVSEKIEEVCSRDIKTLQKKTLKFYKRQWGQYFNEIPLADWEGNPLDEVEPPKQVDSQKAKKCIASKNEKIKKAIAPKQEEYTAFVKLLSNDNEKTMLDIHLFFEKPCEYITQSDLLEVPKHVNDGFADEGMVEILSTHNLLLVIDWKESLEQYAYDGYLQELQEKALASNDCIAKLIEEDGFFENEQTLDKVFKSNGDTALFRCIDEAGYALFSFDKNADAYYVGIVDKNKVKKLQDYEFITVI